MAPGTLTVVKNWPAPAQFTAAKLEQVGFREGRLSYVRHYPLDRFADGRNRIQIRNIPQLAPPNKVAHYKEMMKPYTNNRDRLIMPPMVVTGDGWLLDGNTRTEAAFGLNWSTFHAIVLADSYEGAPQSLINRFKTLGARLNNDHGEPLPAADIERIALGILADDPGMSTVDLAALMQVSRAKITNAQNAHKATVRAERLSVALAPQVTRTHLADLGAKDDRFTDLVFVGLLSLIRDRNLSTNEQRVIIRRLAEHGSEEAKLGYLREEYESRDVMVPGTVGRKPPTSGIARQRAGFFLRFENREGALVEPSPAAAALHRQTLTRLLGVVSKALSAQEALDFQRDLQG
jgi:hypothetical protein